jgi:hypothetical protein
MRKAGLVLLTTMTLLAASARANDAVDFKTFDLIATHDYATQANAVINSPIVGRVQTDYANMSSVFGEVLDFGTASFTSAKFDASISLSQFSAAFLAAVPLNTLPPITSTVQVTYQAFDDYTFATSVQFLATTPAVLDPFATSGSIYARGMDIYVRDAVDLGFHFRTMDAAMAQSLFQSLLAKPILVTDPVPHFYFYENYLNYANSAITDGHEVVGSIEAFTPITTGVPEPSSVAMMLVGAVVVAGTLRRRLRSRA